MDPHSGGKFRVAENEGRDLPRRRGKHRQFRPEGLPQMVGNFGGGEFGRRRRLRGDDDLEVHLALFHQFQNGLGADGDPPGQPGLGIEDRFPRRAADGT